MSNAVLERIHQVLGSLVRTFNVSTQTYVEKNDRWTGILATSAFVILSTTNKIKGYSPVQLISGHDIILPINIGWSGNKYVSKIRRKWLEITRYKINIELPSTIN